MKINRKKMMETIPYNKNVIVGVLTFALVFSMFIVPLVNKGTHSSDTEETGVVSLSCPANITIDTSSFECLLVLNSTKTIRAVSAMYDVGNKSIYENPSLMPNEDWNSYYNDSTGFVVVSSVGVTESNKTLGSVKYIVSNEALVDNYDNVRLYNIQIAYEDGTEETIDELVGQVKIIANDTTEEDEGSDVNTLSDIKINDGDIVLSPSFSSDIYEYTATTDSEEITITTTKTDENSTVTGDGKKSLVLGENTIVIMVESESNVVNGYILTVTRVDKVDEEILSDVNTLSDIKINNGDIVLSPSFSSEIYEYTATTDSEEITITTTKTDENSTVTGDGNKVLDVGVNNFSVSVTSQSGKTREYKLIITRNEVKEETYSLTFDDSLDVDSDKKYIKYLSIGTKSSDLIGKVTVVSGTVKLYDVNGKEKNNDDLLASGDILKIYSNNVIKAEYTISVMGDSNGDGVIDLIDLVQLRKHVAGWIDSTTGDVYVKTGVYFYSLDLNKDSVIDLIDVVRMRKIIAGVN